MADKVIKPVEETEEDTDDMTGAPAWAKTLYKYMTKLDSVVNGDTTNGTPKEDNTPTEERPKSKHWLFGE